MTLKIICLFIALVMISSIEVQAKKAHSQDNLVGNPQEVNPEDSKKILDVLNANLNALKDDSENVISLKR